MMKSKATGRMATLAALTLALGGAVFLNWSFSSQTVLPSSAAAADGSTADPAVQAQAAPADPAAQTVLDPLETGSASAEADTADAGGETGKNYGEAQLVSVSRDTGTEFFEQARLSRSKARDEALDTIQKTLKNTALTDTEKEELTQKLQSQISSITTEATLESLIKSKGFADCVVSLSDSRADVTVMTENDALTADEVTRIRDAVLSACKGMSAQDITVVEVK